MEWLIYLIASMLGDCISDMDVWCVLRTEDMLIIRLWDPSINPLILNHDPIDWGK